MLVASSTTGQQQLGKSSTLSLNTVNCLPSGSVCVITNTTTSSSSNASGSPNNLSIMSSSHDVSTPTTSANVSPNSNNNNSNGNQLKCSNNSNNNANQKYEAPTYGGNNVTSPCNSDGNNSQNIDDSGSNKNKNKNNSNGGVNLAAMDSTSRGERDSLSNISSNSLLRQSSASTNSCSVQFHESSPNNGDSSSSSSNASHMNNNNNNNDSNKTNEEEKLCNNQTAKSNTIIKDEERDKSNSSSSTTSSSSGNPTTNATLSNQNSISNIKGGLASTAIVKDEKDLVKKEENSLSPPNMSPVGFGSIVGTQMNECGDNPGSTTNKSNDSSSSTSCEKRMGLSVCNESEDSSQVTQPTGGIIGSGAGGANLNLLNSVGNALNSNTNPMNSKSSLDSFCSSDVSTSTQIGSNAPCNIPLNTASFIINNLSSTNGPPSQQQGGGGVAGATNLISGGSSGINNCMEYMQQQKHVFVFSTQLANKGAEAVLAGQFPTIIAYHCTQPATKAFFEDFFLKNPMKMTKLQRQNTLNIMGGLPPVSVPGSSGQQQQPPWLTGGNCNTMGKISSHKLALNKTETLTSSSSNAGVLNEHDMMCWDQTRSVIDSPAGDSANSMKMLENAENSNNATKSSAICSGLSNDDSAGGIPSLQGVKVPDENLTPQQRQHREEQLAKLKKMNQFLFPENGGNDFHSQTAANNPMMTNKMQQVPPEALAGGGVVGSGGNAAALLNMQGSSMGNKLNAAAMRNISGNLMNHSKTGNSNSQLDNMPNLGEDIIMPGDMMAGTGCGGGPNDMSGVIPGSSIKPGGCITNMNNSGGGGGRGGLLNSNGPNLNMLNNNGPMGMSSSGNLINDPNNIMMGNSSSDVLSPFNSNHCPNSVQEGSSMMGPHKNINIPPTHPSDLNSNVGVSQMEWSKLHHHLYEERLKNNHSNNNSMNSEIGAGPAGCQQTLQRCNSTGIGGNSAGGISHRPNSNANANTRGNQGPPPPYHPTQRSASVPIATQSPNPSSPNNPTSNMSLPSPRATNTMSGGIPISSTTSPSMDVTSSASSASTANSNTTTTTTAVGGGSGGNGTTNKNTFSQQGSPTPGSGNPNRNRSTVNNLNSNPTTPLSHVSPKDIDSKNMNTTPTPDHKSARPNSQRSRSPLLNDVPNNSMEPRFPSPGLNFASGTSAGNNQNLPNSFKSQSLNLERQNMQQMPSQFCRRTDNMPLNPNSNRSNQTKLSNSFDPISSLAQMSQQLTGGGGGVVGLNSGGVGSSPNNMSGLMGGPGDISMNGLMGGPMMGVVGPPIDGSMEHCNQNPNSIGGGNMGMSGLGVGPGPFGPGNCNMMGANPGPICQRLLNPKMCGPPNMSGGFNPNQVGGMGMREGPTGFPGMMPTHRMMNHRMSANFGNFNVSPNIQVKASTPNTIQYMPVRPQNNNNNNNNNNMRVPPSLEFLQRYANPQMMGGNSGGVGVGLGGGPGPGGGGPPSDMPSMNGPSDLIKMPNTNNNMGVNSNAMNQMNFFGNCNQMSGMGGGVGGGMGQPGNDPDELQTGGGMMSNHDSMNIPGPHAPILRGMRPMRQSVGMQSGVGGMNTPSRMQHPGMGGSIPPNGLVANNHHSFAGNDNESLDCNDPSNNMFNNAAAAAAAAAGLYQQKNNKPPPMGMSHGPPNLNQNNGNNLPLPNNNSNNVMNEQNSSSTPMQNSIMMNPNNSMLNSNNGGGGGSGGPLSGPGSNMGYKPFVGPTSSDLKYAQQYHSFQQQLYATSTRNQQPGGVGGGGQQQPSNAMSPNSNPNAGFFVNK